MPNVTPEDEATHAPQDETSGLPERYKAALDDVRRTLPGQLPPEPADTLAQLAAVAAQRERPGQWDRYGQAGPVAELEARVAELLGKPAAVMFPSGVMAQQATLRVWCDRQGSRRVALPELSHLLHHELDGPQLLHDFRYERLTVGPIVPTAEHLAKVPGPLGAVLTELPLRDGGYLLPDWDELAGLSSRCRERGVPLHFDGARIWESQSHLGKPLAEIAALADSVYVSFYKGLRGLAGAAVGGPEELVAELRQWRTRQGGSLFTMFPYAVSALRGLDVELPRMGEYHARAVELAAALGQRGMRTFPETPHTNAFRLFVPAPHETVTERVVTVMEEERLFIAPPFAVSDVPGWSWTEFTVGADTMSWGVAEAAETLERVLLATG